MKEYEVELKSTTYATYKVVAKDTNEAHDLAFDEMACDTYRSKAWCENAKVNSIEELEIK